MTLRIGTRLRRDGPYSYEGTIVAITGVRHCQIVLQIAENDASALYISESIKMGEWYAREYFSLTESTKLALEAMCNDKE